MSGVDQMLEGVAGVIAALNALEKKIPSEHDALKREALMIRDAFANRKTALELMAKPAIDNFELIQISLVKEGGIPFKEPPL